MKRTAVVLSVTLAAGIYLGAVGNQILDAQQEPIKRTVLLKTDLAGMEGKEAILALAEIAPGAATGKHTHPGYEFAYVLEGSGILEIEGKPSIPLTPGTAIYQPSTQVHRGVNNSATDPLKIFSVYIVEKGHPLAVPVK
ncbi:MAG TPA: cupin domain-containing protein [Candidatus Methylomirabilis sp.]|nr:cupin domain-containing protein [Candidatus Methylomirabilis sp.]